MRRVRWALSCLMVLMIAISPPLAGSIRAAPMATSTPAEPRLHAAIAAAIPPDTGRGVIRLPSVRLDDTGDLTVVVALRERDNLADFRTAAAEDVFQILRAVYSTPDTGVRTVTVVGTYSVTGTYGARETRVLRVVLPATTAKALDWSTASPDRLFTAAETYRFYPPFGDELGNPVVPASASARDPVISSPVDIGGRNLFLRCIGSGRPTVILESGYGDNGAIWAPVQIHASEFVRVCSYDRAGLERSDPPDHYPRTGAEVVADLHAALQKDGVQPPYLLVGQSQGAIFSRLFAATYPGEVAGMLLLDPWPEAFDTKLQAMVTSAQWRQYQALLAAEPDNEVIDFPATYAELRNAGPLPNVPLLVLSHGLAPTAAGYPPGWPVTQQEQLWQTLQQAMATLTPRGEQRVVADSGDMIQLAKPEAVVVALRDMVDQLRA
ncbi:MAG: alpha/beta hydrolase [Thermomicrobiales bacterium]